MSTSGDSDWDDMQDIDEPCVNGDHCPSQCAHHLPAHTEVWYDRIETVAFHEPVLEAAKRGCKHCQFLKAAGHAVLAAAKSTQPRSALAQVWAKLPDTQQGLADLDQVPGLDIKSYRMVTTSKDSSQYDLSIILSLHGSDFATLDYTVGELPKVVRNAVRAAVSDLPGIVPTETSAVHHGDERYFDRIPQTMPFADMGLENALSSKSLKFMRECIGACRNHIVCGRGQSIGYPRRLLDLSNDKIQMREDYRYTGSFAALSYTWGPIDNRARLTKINHSRRLTDPIDSASVPATLMDAIRVTRGLGISYLWIDSLCIIQDDDKDRQDEIKNMHTVYHDALVVISADCARDASSGFLDRRGLFDPVEVECHGTKFQLLETSNHNRDSYTAQRAWCLQERVVARRTLMFTTTEIIWECLAGTTCQCGRDRNNKNNFWTDESTALAFDSSYLIPYDGPQVPKVLNGLIRLTPHSYWIQSVQRFSRRGISSIADRLPAISALATQLEPYIPGRYLEGHWEHDLVPSLLWTTSVDASCRMRGSNQPLGVDRRATWSWASAFGPVSWPSADEAGSKPLVTRVTMPSRHAQSPPLSHFLARAIDLEGPLRMIIARCTPDQSGVELFMGGGDEGVWSHKIPSNRTDGAHGIEAFDGRAVDFVPIRRQTGTVWTMRRGWRTQQLFPLGSGSCFMLWITATQALLLTLPGRAVHVEGEAVMERIGMIACDFPAQTRIAKIVLL